MSKGWAMYVVVYSTRSSYPCDCLPVAWFMNEREAEDYCRRARDDGNYCCTVHSVPYAGSVE